jgi:hypothetical protein
MILVSSNAQNPTFSLRAIKDSEKLCSSFGGHLKIVNNTSRRRKERDLTSYPYLKAYEPSHSSRTDIRPLIHLGTLHMF